MSWSGPYHGISHHRPSQLASYARAPQRIYNPLQYAHRPQDELESGTHSRDAAMQLAPLRMNIMVHQPQMTPNRAPSKALKIADLIDSGNATELKQEAAQRRQSTTSAAYTLTPSIQHARKPEHTQPCWDDFITRYADQPASSIRAQSRDRGSEKASRCSGTSQMSSPSAHSTEVSRQLSPYIPGAASPSSKTSAPPPYKYNLSVRQQPEAARACGHGDRDRRVIDPPPILELKVTRADRSPTQDSDAIFALHCSLLDADTGKQATSEDPGYRMANVMMGASVASPFHGKDEHDIAGTFFIFSDLSCRYHGRFRLQFELLRIDRCNMHLGARHGTVAMIETQEFTAFTAKDFPGMKASTPLLIALRRQGLPVGIKKGSEARKAKCSGLRRSSSEDSSESGEFIVGTGGKRKARAPREDSSRSSVTGVKVSKTKRRARPALEPF